MLKLGSSIRELRSAQCNGCPKRKNSHAICSRCQKPAPGYDQPLPERRFEFVLLLGHPGFPASTECGGCSVKTCGVKVEQVPWADGKKELTKTYMLVSGILGKKSCHGRKWPVHLQYFMGEGVSLLSNTWLSGVRPTSLS